MKLIRYLICLAAGSFFAVSGIKAQNQSGEDSTGLPGDHFSLQGALQLFQNAANPEEFEKALNTEGNHVNNLDLDEDGDIDYVKVISKMEKNVHVFILQVPVSATENQDIAVIELEKTGDETAMIQIIGDEDIYGEQVIVEPDSGEENAYSLNNNSNLSGPNAVFENQPALPIVNVWLWPSVRFVFGPVYRPWASPWRWHYYPAWWKPWKPYRWHVWHPFRIHYHRPFVVVHTHRVIHAHRVYTPFRATSVTLRTRHSNAVGHYRVTRTKTTVTGPRGRSATKTSTTVTKRNGKVKAKKTTVRRGRH